MGKTSIPTDAEFARASEAMRARDRGLSEVRQAMLSRFGGEGLHELLVLHSSRTGLYKAYVFFENDSALQAAKRSGTVDSLKTAVADELVRASRGEPASLNLEFEFDTDQHVQDAYDGDYYSRLR